MPDEKQKNAPRQGDAHRGRVDGVGRSSTSLADNSKRGSASLVVRQRRVDDPPEINELRKLVIAAPPEVGKHLGPIIGLLLRLVDRNGDDVRRLGDDVVDMRRNTDSIPSIIEMLRELKTSVEKRNIEDSVKFPPELTQLHVDCIRTELKSLCPCCRLHLVLTQPGHFDGGLAHREHFRDRHLIAPEHTWIICVRCHKNKTEGRDLDLSDAAFKLYQQILRSFLKRRPAQQRLL